MSRKRKFDAVDSDNSDADEPILPPQKPGVNLDELPYSRPNNSHIKNKIRNKYQLHYQSRVGIWIDQITNR
jgi:hypothetical protein